MSAPALSVYRGDGQDADDRLSPSTTVSQFFSRWFLPQYCGKRRRPLSPRTVDEFRTVIGRWCRLMGDTPLRDVTLELCRGFAEKCIDAPGRDGPLAARTVFKYCQAMATIFAMAGPITPEHRDAATEDGLFGLDRFGRPRPAPWFPPIDVPETLAKDVFELAEVEAWLTACEQATQPRLRECRPAAWWRSLILFIYNSGLRIGTAIKLRRRHVHERGELVWLEPPREIYKQGKSKLICLSTHAVEALRSIPTLDVIWPWPHTEKHLQDCRRKLLAIAGIPAARQFGFHALRKMAGTELFSVSPAAAQQQLGHKSLDTTINHYVSKRGQIASQARNVLPALEQIPQPGRRDPQLLLF